MYKDRKRTLECREKLKKLRCPYYSSLHEFAMLKRRVIAQKVRLGNQSRKKIKKLRASSEQREINAKSKYRNLIKKEENLSF